MSESLSCEVATSTGDQIRHRAGILPALARERIARSGSEAATASSIGPPASADVAAEGAATELGGPQAGPYFGAVRHDLRRTREHLLALLLCVGLSLGILGPWILGRMSSWFLATQPQDGSIFLWMLSWWPHAFAHHIDPMYTTVAWAPGGINLAWVTSVPALAVLMTPITHAWGPSFAFNLAQLAAPALASWTGYLLCRRITGQFVPALMGGLCFGFSPFLISQVGQGHPNLSLIFLVPVAAYLVLRLVEGSIRARWFVPVLGIVLAVQIYLSTEVFLTMTLIGALSGIVVLTLGGRAGRQRLLRAGGPIIGAYVVAFALGSPLLYVAFSRPRPYKSVFFHGLSHGARSAADFLAYVVPGRFTILGGQLGQHWGPDGNPWYFGIPLLLLLILFLVTERRRRRTWVLAAALVLTLALSAGGTLAVFGARILPWRLLSTVPVVNAAEPGRLVSYAFLLIGMAVAMWLAQPTRRRARRALAVLALLVMLPNVTSNVWARHVSEPPQLLASGAYHTYLTPGETVWVVTPQTRRQLSWQAETGFSFRLAGGFFGVTPPGLRPLPAIQARLGGGRMTGATVANIRVFLRSHHVGAVLMAGEPPAVRRAMTRATRARGVWHQGMVVFQLGARNASTPSAR